MKPKLRFLVQLSVVGCLLALVACNRDGTQAHSESTVDKVQRTGTLRLGYFLFEPTIVIEPNSTKVKGLFIDVAEQLARDMRWKIEYRQVDLKNFAAGLQAGEFDLSIGATFSSPSRASGVAFTNPLFYLGYTGVTTSENAKRFHSWADIDQPGVRVAVKQGSAIGDYVRRSFKKATIVALEEPALSAPLAAVPGQADVGLMNQITVFTFLRDNQGHNLVEILADQPMEFTGICWAVRPDDERWLQFINTALKHYIDTGRYQEWERAYSVPYMYHEQRQFRFVAPGRTGDTQR